ncbi:MAG: hypothetical protein ABR541_04100 [Candidatus Dormibacteria bacterium]
MLVYAVVIAALVGLLIISFRALSGGEVLTEADYHTVLVSLADFTSQRREELSAGLAAGRPAGDTIDPAVETAVAARKKLAGYQQQLARFEAGAERYEEARGLLSAAIEDLGWACRMVEPGTYWDNPGIQEAVAALRSHGGRCLVQSQALLAGPPPAPAE